MKNLLIVALCLGCAAIGSAQTDLTPSGVSIRGGFGWPSDGAVRNGDRLLWGLGADYYFSDSLIRGHKTYMSFDYLGRSGSGTTVNLFPIMGNIRFGIKDPQGIDSKLYGYAGLGIVFIEVGSVKSKGVFGARLGFGVDMSDHVFFETNYLFTGANAGIRGNSLNFYVGYRF